MKKILLTGGSGMVGRNFLEHKKSKNYEILYPSSNQLDLLDNNGVYEYLNQEMPDLVIHCAGKVGGIQANVLDPVGFFSENLIIGTNLISNSYKLGIKKLINLGSSCMYPRVANNPLKESYILSGMLEPTNEGYALAKAAVAKYCEYISNSDKSFKYRNLIPCNIYGKYDKFDGINSHLIPAIIAKVHSAMEKCSRSVEVWGDGSARREFMYAEDLADAMYCCIEQIDLLGNYTNIGNGYDLSVNDYYKSVIKVMGYKGDLTYDLSKPVGMVQKVVDISNIKKIGWSPAWSLDEGIRESYKYYLNRSDL
ncbi:MAG: GDP-L-fucose synthetase [Fluviibacter phosphoraccumulans EoVTN8]